MTDNEHMLMNEINRLEMRVTDLEDTVHLLINAFDKRQDAQTRINSQIINSLNNVATLLEKHSKRLDALSKDNEKENSHDKNR